MLILFTAFSVSIDAYVAGLAFSLGERVSLKHTICVFVYTFALCCVTLFIGGLISRYSLFFKISGCVLFVFLGIKNICGYKKRAEQKSTNASLVGISVGLDASVACLSFSLPVLHAFAVAFTMAVFHLVFFVLGQRSARFLKTAESMSFVSGVFLVLLGIYKFF